MVMEASGGYSGPLPATLPAARLSSTDLGDGLYAVEVDYVPHSIGLGELRYELADDDGTIQAQGEIALRNRSGTVVGVESLVTWQAKHPDGDPEHAARAYDFEYRTDTCAADEERDGAFPVVFYDRDLDDRLTAGDSFLIRVGDTGADFSGGWLLRIEYIHSEELVAWTWL